MIDGYELDIAFGWEGVSGAHGVQVLKYIYLVVTSG
jgi:hypothetical protein